YYVFLNSDREFTFLVFACLSFNIIVSYSLGITKGLYLSVAFVAIFSGYTLYDLVAQEKIAADAYISFFHCCVFPSAVF
ncbi:MAG: hypothetical protein LUC29_08925, partial [Acidaminococcaceae bacterium]|nr:hypothetical protein [Acidaminococcaceae bacterium]